MNELNEIAQRIYVKSDAELRKKIKESVAWVWEESGHSAPRPDSRFAEIKSELGGLSGDFSVERVPWIGSASRLFEVVAFHYLRDKYRQKAISDFMQKIDEVSEAINQDPV